MSNSSAKIFSAIPITGALGIDNVLLCLDSKLSTETRVTSGIMLALKLGLLITVIVLSSTMLDINASIECDSAVYGQGRSCSFTGQEWDTLIPPSGPENCPEYKAVLNSKDFRTWYKKQEYLQAEMPTTGEQFNQACREYMSARKKQHMTNQQLSIVVGVIWIIGLVVAFRAK